MTYNTLINRLIQVSFYVSMYIESQHQQIDQCQKEWIVNKPHVCKNLESTCRDIGGIKARIARFLNVLVEVRL